MEGQASCEYFLGKGDEVTVCDQNSELKLPKGVSTQLGPDYLSDLDQFDLIVRTPGIHPDLILDKNPQVGSKITTQINEFLRVCPTRNVIGVTGTKGKGTTSTLITKILEAAGKKVLLAGNVGEPALSHMKELNSDWWVVLELSSFQLIDLQHSPHIAVCLMVVPEHLNWHADMNEYMTAKMQLFAHQTHEDIAIFFAGNDNSKEIAGAGSGQKLPYYQTPGAYVDEGVITIDGKTICKTDELKLLGKHNWQNACAAVTAVWQVIQDVEAIRSVLINFSGLPHRIEFVREVRGVRFYNDSFATGLHATEAAIEAVPGKKVMILGGFDRNIPLEHFGEFARDHAEDFRTLLVIGQSAERLAETLKANDFDNFVVDKSVTDMPAIVARANELAQEGDAVVLSPGFASFDMFKNFEERGNKFRETVNAL